MEEKTQAEARLRRTESPSRHVGEREGRRDVEEQVLAQTRVKRLFRFFQIFAFNLAYMSSWEGTAVNMYYALIQGGAPTLTWSTLIAYIGALFQSASIAELASMQPIAGAQYHWTWTLAPPAHRRCITWFQGWVTWWGWIALLAGVFNVNAVTLQNSIVAVRPGYADAVRGWHTSVIMLGIIAVAGAVNVWGWRGVPWVETGVGALHVGAWVAFLGVIGGLGWERGEVKSSREVFVEGEWGRSGWEDRFISFNVGMLATVWSFTGFDGAVHMAEEVKRARDAVPKAVFWSIAVNGILAFPIVVVFAYVMGPLDQVLTSSQPIFLIMERITESRNATAAMGMIFFVVIFGCSIASVATVSRLTWAWSRDRALWKYFSVLSGAYAIPNRATALCLFISACLSLVNIGSSVAFSAIIALSILGVFFSYLVNITLMLMARWNGEIRELTLGSWNLGRWGAMINIVAWIYTAWVMVFLPFPNFLPVTMQNMNFAGPVFGVVLAIVWVGWWAWGKDKWRGVDGDIVKVVVGGS
ncbi:amino acid transporter [Corynespora cassiicola Philippines]|uniref:Amino acid transporter n=1 Tax=Corynespora cassiicola Philippines TaxID=1448308 RepID=A0A2T2PAE6_CORCC|nr:amino acid transporter [Corynespora cassiicola Philippines]